jgi:hypothetical protein
MTIVFRKLIWFTGLLLMAGIGLLPDGAFAAEGGAGHYLPGGTSSFIDTLPGRPGFAYLNVFTYYHASGGASRTLKFGGLSAFNLDATVYVDTSLFLYTAPWDILGGYGAIGIAIPYVWMDVSGVAELQAGGHSFPSHSVSDSAVGLGDIEIFPFMLGWKRGDFKYDVRLAIYAPTGGYDFGHLANVGKNYWTFEPGASFNYLSSRIGLEVTAFAGFDFNTTNSVFRYEYHTGDEFHLEATVAEHLPLFGGFIGVGANVFYVKQFTADSGSGAALGSLEGHTTGIGPVVSYTLKIASTDLVAEAKWLPELDTRYRLDGDYVWFKIGAVF